MKMATFTALNGGSPKAISDTNGGSVEVSRAGSAERVNGPAPSADEPPRDQLPSEVSPTQGERGGWATGGPSSDRPTYSSASYAETESSHKRKRSDDSVDGPRREVPPQMERQQEDARPERSQLSESRERDPYEREHREHEYRSYGDETRDRDHGRESWYSPRESRGDRQPYSQPASAVPDSAHTEEQIGEVLRRATEPDYPQTSPDEDDRGMSYSGQYTPEQRRDGVIQSDPKKRKRNFSNRTKTGCLTCRKRKKKCDEGKPECEYTVFFLCVSLWPQEAMLKGP